MENPGSRRRFMGGMLAAFAAPGGWNIRDYGAIGDGVRLNTKSIQDAIDACARAGGGTVWIPPGVYVSGTLVLKSHVTLHLDRGATLSGSRSLGDYPAHVPAMRSYTDTYTEKSLIYAEGAEDIGIEGHGMLDGHGAAFKGPYKVRPYMLRFVECRDVSMEGVTIKDSPMWVQHYLGCEGVRIRGITVRSRVNHNNDGIDIDCSRRVRISDCDISSGDDAIVLKSTADRRTSDVAISNCVLSTACNALKLGTESNGGFEDISIANCTVYDTGLAGLALETVDGGVLERVSVTNVNMRNVSAPIFMRLGDRGRPFREGGARPGIGRFRDVIVSNVQATASRNTGCAIAGLPGHAIENVTLENIRLRFPGGGTRADAERAVPEVPEKYPEYGMFGTLPAYALYCRHVRNLKLRGVETSVARPDERQPIVFSDVEGVEKA